MGLRHLSWADWNFIFSSHAFGLLKHPNLLLTIYQYSGVDNINPVDEDRDGNDTDDIGYNFDNLCRTSLEENVAGFSRDQFGRQSMSEKRHATLDAKNTDTYQRNKKARCASVCFSLNKLKVLDEYYFFQILNFAKRATQTKVRSVKIHVSLIIVRVKCVP